MQIPLTKNHFAIVDDSDFDAVRGMRWQLHIAGEHKYAAHSVRVKGKKKTILMHRWLMDAKKGELVDHADRNGLNNTRENMRIASRQQNGWNRKAAKHGCGLKGVSKRKDRPTYRATYYEKGNKQIHLGCFMTAELAHEAWAKFASLMHGDFFRER